MGPAVPYVFSTPSDQDVLRPLLPAPASTATPGPVGHGSALRGGADARDVPR